MSAQLTGGEPPARAGVPLPRAGRVVAAAFALFLVAVGGLAAYAVYLYSTFLAVELDPFAMLGLPVMLGVTSLTTFASLRLACVMARAAWAATPPRMRRVLGMRHE